MKYLVIAADGRMETRKDNAKTISLRVLRGIIKSEVGTVKHV